MTEPADDTARDIGSPFRMFSPTDTAQLFDMDFSPRPVKASDIHPSEADVSPKESSSPVQESVTISSEKTDPTVDPGAGVAKESGEKLEPASTSSESAEVLSDSPSKTSPGESKPPAVTPPLPPAKTPSSLNEAK